MTKDYEQIIAMLARLRPDPKTDSEERELDERMRAVANNFPDILAEMKPTARQLRDARKAYGLKPPEGGSLLDLPLLSVRGEKLNHAVMQFGRKLGLALFYKHSNHILPASGGIALRWYSNLQIDADEVPRDLAPLLNQFPKLVRNSTNLGKQFFYRIGVAEDRPMVAFFALFRESFGILGFVGVEASDMNVPEGEPFFGPFDPLARSEGE